MFHLQFQPVVCLVLFSVVGGGRGGLPGGDGVQRAADEARRPAAARAVVQGGAQLAHLHLRRARHRQELPRRGSPLLAPGTLTTLRLSPMNSNLSI